MRSPTSNMAFLAGLIAVPAQTSIRVEADRRDTTGCGWGRCLGGVLRPAVHGCECSRCPAGVVGISASTGRLSGDGHGLGPRVRRRLGRATAAAGVAAAGELG